VRFCLLRKAHFAVSGAYDVPSARERHQRSLMIAIYKSLKTSAEMGHA